jgi:hypothetical protein
MDQDGIIAIGLLTQRDIDLLGPTFTRLWPVDEAPHFLALLQAIDRADEELRQRGADAEPVDR